MPLVPDDPTLLFTNAGMVQFKDIFTGAIPAPQNKTATSCQLCIRAGGKHNDLENVGYTARHHTLFEMLGNFSFGDYFKEDAIAYAWEFITVNLALPVDKLWVTIHDTDDEAFDIWKKYIDPSRIKRFGDKDNFWAMGDTGPCGPCSEIFYDQGAENFGSDEDYLGGDGDRFLEIWNLVFMQFNRKADGSLEPLPHQHVDTGMGFERLCMAMQGKTSNYDTDVFQPIIQTIAKMGGKVYGNDEEIDIALRVIADHIRTIAFAITDGQLPSNNKAGYVIRRILRRAVRYGYTFLGFKDPFMYRLIPVLIEVMGQHFPELVKQQTLIEKVVKEEENSFLRTLENGIKLLDQIIEKTKADDFKVVPGKLAFELYDTYGFPLDLTELILKEQDLVVNRKEFNTEMEAQKNRSRSATSVDTGDWVELLKDDVEEFVGYDYLSTDVRITRYRKITSKGKDSYQMVFNITPFYGESGGQVGDTGYIEANGQKISIIDTKKEHGLIVHFAKELPTDPTATFKAVVSTSKRNLTANNHTATHLMHHALREILGDHVEQKGSLVNPDHLRFDFSHFQKVTDEEIAKVEAIVNKKIRENIAIEIKNHIPMAEAVNMGAMALFGEKYGDLVRVVKFNDSVELCGGTHVEATGQIGLFKIISEGAISAGVRRIEAITADKAEQYINDKLNTLRNIEKIFKSSQNLLKNIEDLMSENSGLKKDLDGFMKDRLKVMKNDLKANISVTKDVNFITEPLTVGSAADLKDIAFQLKGEVDNLVFITGADLGGKANLTIMFSDNLVKEYDLHAGNIVREAAKEIKGGGGGQPFFASAGGKDPKGLEQAIETAKKMVLHKIEG
jgi:alanyl-tRNA synthetase